MIPHEKKAYRIKYIVRNPRRPREVKTAPPAMPPPVSVNLEEMPKGMTFQRMDQIIRSRGTPVCLPQTNTING